MKQSKLLIPTRHCAEEIDTISERLLVQAGYVTKLATGIYAYLPLAERVIEKISQVIEQELSTRNSIKMRMPNLLPQEYSLEECASQASENLFSVNDAASETYMLAPAHERSFMELIMKEVRSYKELPLSLFQTQMKYRDEAKKQRGLIDSREFLMTDVYSFHADQASLDQFYREMEESLERILIKCGLSFKVVNGASKRIGARALREFLIPTPIGQKIFCYASEGAYAATLTVATSDTITKKSHATYQPLEKTTVFDLQEAPLDQTIKPLFYLINETIVVLLLRADHLLNEEKVKHFFQQKQITALGEQELLDLIPDFNDKEIFEIIARFEVFADPSLADLVNAQLSSHTLDLAYRHVNFGRELIVTRFFDMQLVKEGDLAPNGQGILHFDRGISVAQMTKLAPAYASQVGAVFLDDQAQTQTLNMGYYGIGLTRVFALIVEMYASEGKMCWPQVIAPFDVHILPLDIHDPFQVELAKQLARELEQAGYDLLIDDRDVESATKQQDASLIGCPIQCTISNKAVEGVIELEIKAKQAILEVRKEEVLSTLSILLQSE
ncbi:proline--tRNA ligase [Enterococcus bulliens]